MIEGLIEKSRTSIPECEGDYVQDGLLYCGKCNTPKEALKNVLGKLRTVRVLCDCGKIKESWDKEYLRQQMIDAEIARAKSVAFPVSDMQGMIFENDDGGNPELSLVAKNYVKMFPDLKKKGLGLLLYGKPGTGKTFAAGCIANALLEQGYRVKMTTFSRVIRGDYSAQDKLAYIDELNAPDLLILDDLGVERESQYVQEIVQTVIDARYRAKKPLIVTTNWTEEDLKKPGEGNRARYMDRLLERCPPYKVDGGSRRKKAMRENHRMLADLLLEEEP